jgi:hypothetical protein
MLSGRNGSADNYYMPAKKSAAGAWPAFTVAKPGHAKRRVEPQ